jgi:hypothetical protein
MITLITSLWMVAAAPSVDAPLRVLVTDARAAANSGAPPGEVAGLTNVVCSALSKQPNLEVMCLPDLRAALDARALMASVAAPVSGKLEEKLAAVERVVTITVERRQNNYALVLVASTRAEKLADGVMPVVDKPVAQVERTAPALGGFLVQLPPMTAELATLLVPAPQTASPQAATPKKPS